MNVNEDETKPSGEHSASHSGHSLKENIQKREEKLTPEKKRKRKTLSSVIFFAALAILVISLMVTLFRGDNTEVFDAAFTAIGQGNHWVYMLIAALLVLVYFAFYPITIFTYAKTLDCEASPVDLWLIANSEHFYNGVTPSSAGGQPFQAYALTNCNVKGSKSTGIILLNYLNMVGVSVFFGFISLIYYPQYVEGLKTVAEGRDLSSLQWIAIVGIILNATNLLFFVFLGVSKKARRAIMAIFDWLCKWRWLGKKIAKHRDFLDNYLNETQEAVKQAGSHIGAVILGFVERVILMSILYAIPFFLLKAVGIEVGWEKFMMVLLGTAFATVCVAWFPTPGGVGASEWVSLVVIGSVAMTSGQSFDSSTSSAVMFLWRGFSFYFVILLSFICSAIFEGRVNRRLKAAPALPKPSEEEIKEEK